MEGTSSVSSTGTPFTVTEPPQDPILRLETDMHNAKISRVSVDAAGQILATASDDKTVRIWELATGRMLRALRPPIGQGNEGKLYAVALSPDGRTMACAGWTGLEWDGAYSVYVFDRASGRVLRRLTGLPSSVANLAYAPDGRMLVVSLHGKHGIRFYRASDEGLLAEDRDYGADSYGAAFDAKGRLVTSSYDGFIRQYDLDFRLLAKAKLAEGARPYGVSLTPDGSRIAVGFENSSQVVVLSSDGLKLLYAADTSDIKKAALNAVTWSADGQTLYAGGQYNQNGQHLIRKWTDQGRGKWTDLPAAGNTIVHLVAVGTGGIAYAASDPAVGVFDAADHRRFYHGPDLVDYRDSDPSFLIAQDGATVQFSYEKAGKAPARFSIVNRVIQPAIASGTALAPHKVTAHGLNVESWKNSATPMLNGRPLRLDQLELSRCLAIAPDEQSFLLGTVWGLRLFDRQGRQIWQVPVPANVWAVNIAGNGQVAAAAMGDGTIRWYRMADGKELLAFFPHPDRRRWMIWTVSGYYDTSPGGEALLGWHKNYGRAVAADFFPTDRFRSLSYRPEVVAKVISTLDEREAVRLAQAGSASLALAGTPASQKPPSGGPSMPASDSFVIKPMLYALVVGVSRYDDPALNLPFAAKDAQDLAAALQRQEGKAYRGVKVTVLTDGEATKGKILDAMDWLDRETTSKDLALILLAGQSMPDKNGLVYFLPSGSKPAQLRKTALPFSDIKNTVGALAGQPILLLDVCRAMDAGGGPPCMTLPAWVNDLGGTGQGAIVLATTGRMQTVQDDPSWGNGALTKAAIEGFTSQGDTAAGPVTAEMLEHYVTERMKSLGGGRLIPVTVIPPMVARLSIGGTPGAGSLEDSRKLASNAPNTAAANESQQSKILRRLPPVVTIVSPQDGAPVSGSSVTVRYTVRAPSGEPVTEVVALVDGRPIPAARGISVVADTPAAEDAREIQVSVPNRDSEVALMAKNRWSVSEPASVRLKWQGKGGSAGSVAKPLLHAVVVGVSKYEDRTLTLGLAAKDAHDLTAALKHQKGRLYEDVVVKELIDGEATKDNILDALDWLDRQTTPKDVAVLFLAGHGVNDKSGTYYFLPSNAKTDQLRRTALPFSDIRNAVAYLPGKALLFADTCHSGDIMGTRRAVADINAVVIELASAENGAVVFASSTGKQFALEDPQWGNGAFTKALVEGLSGKAAYGQGSAVTVNMLDLYLSERVKALTKGQQTPTTAKPQTIQDFPVAVKIS
jgi:uncharacterized caspase-like protein